MFDVNDIPPIDSWALQDLIAENVRHEEFLFFRLYAGDEQDFFIPDSYTRRYECFCTACGNGLLSRIRQARRANGECARAAAGTLRPSGGRQTIMRRRCAKYHSRFTFFQVGAHGELWLTSCQVRMYPYFLIEKYTAFEYCRYVFLPPVRKSGAGSMTAGRCGKTARSGTGTTWAAPPG